LNKVKPGNVPFPDMKKPEGIFPSGSDYTAQSQISFILNKSQNKQHNIHNKVSLKSIRQNSQTNAVYINYRAFNPGKGIEIFSIK